jgi:hypothetical protein
MDRRRMARAYLRYVGALQTPHGRLYFGWSDRGPYDYASNPSYSVRPDGAYHQWRKIPPRELSIDLVADERLVWATERAEAS